MNKMRFTQKMLLLLGVLFLVSACEQGAERQRILPQVPGDDAIGFFCNMLLSEHEGPKSQILLRGEEAPVWFTSVRDGIAFTQLPEEAHRISGLFVTAVDSLTEVNLQHPERYENAWIDAQWAIYVIESDKLGGMGTEEAFPFRDHEQASLFAETHGGRLVRFSDIPVEYVLGNSKTQAAPAGAHKGH